MLEYSAVCQKSYIFYSKVAVQSFENCTITETNFDKSIQIFQKKERKIEL